MSTWISKALGQILLLSFLAACSGLNDAAVTRATVAGGAVTLAAPRGYCVDASALRDGTRGAFALFGSCAALAPGPFAPEPKPLAVLSAAVSAPRAGAVPALEGSADRMKAFLTSSAGRRALSRDNDAESVRILRTRFEDGVFYIRLRDTGTTVGPRVAPEYWRALLDIDQRMVTLSVLALEDAPLDEAAGEAVIRGFVASVRAANRR
jgi:hypothetical protein